MTHTHTHDPKTCPPQHLQRSDRLIHFSCPISKPSTTTSVARLCILCIAHVWQLQQLQFALETVGSHFAARDSVICDVSATSLRYQSRRGGGGMGGGMGGMGGKGMGGGMSMGGGAMGGFQMLDDWTAPSFFVFMKQLLGSHRPFSPTCHQDQLGYLTLDCVISQLYLPENRWQALFHYMSSVCLQARINKNCDIVQEGVSLNFLRFLVASWHVADWAWRKAGRYAERCQPSKFDSSEVVLLAREWGANTCDEQTSVVCDVSQTLALLCTRGRRWCRLIFAMQDSAKPKERRAALDFFWPGRHAVLKKVLLIFCCTYV